MIRAYKTEIKPTKKQVEYFNKACGTSRFIYNWGLDRRIKYYEETKKSLTYAKQNLELTILKKENEWMYEVGKFVHQNALRNLQTAFNNFFRGNKSGVGFPKFKSKHKDRNSFQIDNDRFYVTNDTIKIQTIGVLKLKERGYIPIEVIKYCYAVISEQAGRWFISVIVEQEDLEKRELTEEVIGVDLGIKTLGTCSDGTIFENPKAYKKYLKQLKREQRRLSRKVKGSNNRNKQKQKLKKVHFRISNIRKDSINKMTTFLTKTKSRTIVIEDLNVKGMLKNHKLAGALSDASFGEIKRQLEYKSIWYSCNLLFVDRFFPSSKLCSTCGSIKDDLTLSDRIYSCSCGNNVDRDLNASINLKNYFNNIPLAEGDFKPVENLTDSLKQESLM